MTPKELLKKHGGDPLAAAEDYDNLAWLDVPFDEDENFRLWLSSALSHQMREFVATVIAHLGEDGVERWGDALFNVLNNVERENVRDWTMGQMMTRIANATDRERLAACLVALAEVDSPKTRVLKMRPDLGCEAVYWQGYIAGYRVFDSADKTIAAERSAWEAWRTAELVALAEVERDA